MPTLISTMIVKAFNNKFTVASSSCCKFLHLLHFSNSCSSNSIIMFFIVNERFRGGIIRLLFFSYKPIMHQKRNCLIQTSFFYVQGRIDLIQFHPIIIRNVFHDIRGFPFTGKCGIYEIVQYILILFAKHQKRICPVNISSGTSNLLVIRNYIRGHLIMYYKGNIPLVIPHTKFYCCNNSFYFVSSEFFLNVFV